MQEKYYYDVIANTIVPVKAKYRVYASSEEEAIKMVMNGKVMPSSIEKPRIFNNNIIELLVYMAGTVNLLIRKRLK